MACKLYISKGILMKNHCFMFVDFLTLSNKMNLKELIQTRIDFNFILVNVIIISYLSMEFHEKGQQNLLPSIYCQTAKKPTK